MAKTYEPQKLGVKKFLENKYLCFQSFTRRVNRRQKCITLRQMAGHRPKPHRLNNLPSNWGLIDMRVQTQGDEFHILPVSQQPIGENALDQNSDTPKRDARNESKRHQNSSQNERIKHEAANVVLLVEESVLVPGYVSVVVYRCEQRFRFTLGERPGSNGDNRASAFSEEWLEIHNCRAPGFLPRVLRMGRIDPAQILGGDLRRRIRNQHQRGLATGETVFAEHDLRSSLKANTLCGQGTAHLSQPTWPNAVFGILSFGLAGAWGWRGGE